LRFPAVRWVLTTLTAALLLGADASSPPEWAYPLNPSKPKPPLDDGAVLQAPGSEVALTRKDIANRFQAVDWRPAEHPPMPEAVAHGRKPDVYACGFCHYPNGQGRPENSSLAGLPAAYIVAQVEAMREGTRNSAQPDMIAPRLMTQIAAHATTAEVAEAAAYFAALKYKPWIRVVETDIAPRPEIRGVSAYAAARDGSREPLGERILEMPEDPARTDLRDDASGFVAYVPIGAVARGRALAASVEGDRQPCAVCHGEGLRGALGPPLAGRSPSYLYRQLFDIQAGARTGANIALMRTEVAALRPAQMRDLVAYVASLPP
jgi:cytochrome c553